MSEWSPALAAYTDEHLLGYFREHPAAIKMFTTSLYYLAMLDGDNRGFDRFCQDRNSRPPRPRAPACDALTLGGGSFVTGSQSKPGSPADALAMMSHDPCPHRGCSTAAPRSPMPMPMPMLP